MEPAASAFEYFNSPEAAFLDPDKLISRYYPQLEVKNIHTPHDHGGLVTNKKQHYLAQSWKITGCAAGGTELFTIPTFIKDCPPIRIHTYIPDLLDQPPHVRERLESATLCHTDFMTGKSHPLADHVLQTLDLWVGGIEDAETKLLMLPFPSTLIIPEIKLDQSQMCIVINPDYEPEQNMLSVDTLKQEWGTEEDPVIFPESVDLNDLVWNSQIHDSVSLVHLHRDPERQTWGFKSSVRGHHHLYHELRLLLSISPHVNILGRPKYIVTKQCCFGGKIGVCGFLVQFFPRGSLSSNISSLRATTTDRELADIVVQVCDGLVELQNSGIYLPDMRTDNIVLSDEAGVLRPILIDFEQGQNWHTWSPPEVKCHDYLHELLKCDSVPESRKQGFSGLLELLHMVSDKAPRKMENTSRITGENCSWDCLSPAQRESATVYLLGKLMWCIFEGFDSVSTINTFWRPLKDASLEFPEFRKTPLNIRGLILKCTIGSPEVEGRFPAVTRLHGRVYARTEVFKDNRNAKQAAKMALEASKVWWQVELEKTESFITSKLLTGSRIAYFERPPLKVVRERLQEQLVKSPSA